VSQILGGPQGRLQVQVREGGAGRGQAVNGSTSTRAGAKQRREGAAGERAAAGKQQTRRQDRCASRRSKLRVAEGCCGVVRRASRSAWRRPESVEAKRRFSGMAVAAITIHTDARRRAGPNPKQCRRFHCAGMARGAPASANAATPSGPPFCRSSRLVARLAVGMRRRWTDGLPMTPLRGAGTAACPGPSTLQMQRRRSAGSTQSKYARSQRMPCACACAIARPLPHARPPASHGTHLLSGRLQPGADDRLGASQAGVVASAWLCSGPGLIRADAAVRALAIYQSL
jgi:hypothetical protein